ncbi:MAG: hypothetical protein J0H43_07875, partial [Actinobacteria bacterium]|nr:hypothetical protein [Actinomycetota bacterium]
WEVDAEVTRVVHMLDRLAAGDVTLTITGLEHLLTRLREAEAARELLTGVDRSTLKAALLLRRQRVSGGAQR